MVMQSLITCCVMYCGNDKKKEEVYSMKIYEKYQGGCVHNHSEIPEKNSLDH